MRDPIVYHASIKHRVPPLQQNTHQPSGLPALASRRPQGPPTSYATLSRCPLYKPTPVHPLHVPLALPHLNRTLLSHVLHSPCDHPTSTRLAHHPEGLQSPDNLTRVPLSAPPPTGVLGKSLPAPVNGVYSLTPLPCPHLSTAGRPALRAGTETESQPMSATISADGEARLVMFRPSLQRP